MMVVCSNAVRPPHKLRNHREHWVCRDNTYRVWWWDGYRWFFIDAASAYAEGWRYIGPAKLADLEEFR